MTELALDAQLTTHFNMREFSVSASHPDLVMPIPAHLRPNVQRLARGVLQPLRDALQRPMRVLSSYRSRTLNAAVGGSVTSQHLKAQAADTACDDLRAAWITILSMVAENRLPAAGQMIYYPQQGFFHVAITSDRYARPTCCVHWPEGGVEGYRVITPTLAAFNAVVPANLDPQRLQTRFA